MTPGGTPQRWWLLALGIMAAVIVAGLAVFTAKYVSRPRPVEIALAPAADASPVEVYLSGAAGQEGIYSVDQDTTLEDVLRRAGIALSGEVPLRIKVAVLGADDGASADTVIQDPSGKINVNTAGAERLESLPGIGPAKARAIIDCRTRNGPFHTVDDLLSVPGIGPQTLENMRDRVTVVD